MVITYHGAAFCKASQGDTTIALSPVGKGAAKTVSKSGADIALIPAALPEYNGIDTVTLGAKTPFAITGPGEYEVGGIIIHGFASTGIEGTINTIYTVIWDDITLCHLGALGDVTLTPSVLEDMGEVDVLLIPVGYDGAPAPRDLIHLAKHLEPKIIIPLPGGASISDASFETFLKELSSRPDPVERYTFKKRDLEGKNGDAIILAGV